MTVEGLWKVDVSTPLGTRHTELELYLKEGSLYGVSRVDEEVIVVKDLRLDGDRLSWQQTVRKPMRMKLVFNVVVAGDDMSGTAKGGLLRGAKVSGRREPAAQPA